MKKGTKVISEVEKISGINQYAHWKITIIANTTDIGKLIGKNGNMINAIKTILNGCKAKDGNSYKIQVVAK